MADPILSAEELSAMISQPQSIAVQGQNVNMRSLPDVIAFDKYLGNKQAAGNGWGSVGIAQAIPPSSTNDNLANED